jgi:hypothetical protein
MALANFLGKSALSASQVLKDFHYEGFQQLLLSHRIGICFDKRTIATAEGFASVDLLVRLLARLYPNLHLRCVDGKCSELDFFGELATSINPLIDLSIVEPTAAIVVGDTATVFTCLQIFIGSDQWLAKFSMKRPQLSGPSVNRFGAGAAACFAAANLFRHVFRCQLPDAQLDEEFVYSTFTACVQEEAMQGPAIREIKLEDTVLVGMGAIGNGAAWTLKDLSLSGALQLVDGQTIDLSNLQRYVLATQDDIGRQKVELIKNYLNPAAIKSYPVHFNEYLAKRGNWNIFRAAVCVDSAGDRRLIQGSLPRKIINAWTQRDQCGVSRHYDFISDPCLACIYHPRLEAKSLPVKIAESFGFTQAPHIFMVRDYMANQRPVDMPMIQLIAHAKGIDPQPLLAYAGKQLQIFYTEVICGGVMMQLAGGTQKEVAEVPSAFESAMAGILLAAELVIDCNGLRLVKAPTIHKLNLLRPLTRYTFDTLDKSYSPDCVCHDPIYQDSYSGKWNIKVNKQAAMQNDSLEQTAIKGVLATGS